MLMELVGLQPWSARELFSAHLTYTSEPVLNLGKLEEVKERGSETQMKRFQVEDYGVIIRRQEKREQCNYIGSANSRRRRGKEKERGDKKKRVWVRGEERRERK